MDGIRYNQDDLVDHEGIAAAIRDERGRVLMQDHVKYGFWTIPVGKAQRGQTPEDALRQELLEECGIAVTGYREIACRPYRYVRDGATVNMVLHLFEIDRWSGELRNMEPHKHRTQEFLAVDEIRRLPYLSDATLLQLETLGYVRPARIADALC